MHIIYSIVRPYFHCEILIIARQGHEPVIITRGVERGVGYTLSFSTVKTTVKRQAAMNTARM